MKNLWSLILVVALAGCSSSSKRDVSDSKSASSGTNTSLARAGLSEKDVIDSYIYLLGRYLVIRQERTDIAEKNLGYNKIKYNPVGQASFVNPNLDVAYLESWIAVDEKSCQVLAVPKISNRYYTVQVLDEWAGIVTNINERTYPQNPAGRFAFCLKGGPETPKNAFRIDLPSNKAKILARVELKDSPSEAVRLQKSFKLIRDASTEIEPAQKIPMFTNQDPIRVEAFEYPIVETVLRSAPDSMNVSKDMQAKVRMVAKYAAQSDANKTQIDDLIKDKALPQFQTFLNTFSSRKGGWVTTAKYKDGFGEDYWFRTAANYGGIWWNVASEVVYFSANVDNEDAQLVGDSTYIFHFDKEALPSKEANAFWSITVLSKPEFMVVPNPARRYKLGSSSKLTYGRDGSLTFAVGAKPKGNIPLTNWIPGPPPGKNFAMTLRLYVPSEQALNGMWFPGPIVKVQGFELQKTSQR